MSITLIIIVITLLATVAAFNNDTLMNKLILWPRYMNTPEEYHRFLSSGFIHADWNHLIFNMYTFYFFGQYVEEAMIGNGLRFALLYVSAIIISSIPSFLKNRNNSYYRSLGASGGVSAVVFFFIYYAPWSRLNLFFFLSMPSIVFAVAYLVYSAVMAKQGRDNVNHDAHMWGSLYGMLFAFLLDPTHGRIFIDQLLHPH